MTIKLTHEIIAAAYELVRTLPPFNGWNLPDHEDVKFEVVKDPKYFAACAVERVGRKLKPTIYVSARCVGYVRTLLDAMMHECIHLHMALTGQDTRAEHNAAFHNLARRVCKIHGLDFKAF